MSRPALEVADIFRDHGAAWRTANAGHVGLNQLKVMAAIENCRTAALGGHVLRCEKCSHTLIAYNSCRNRHCPKCQGAAANEWLAEREAELLPAPYFHVVFSLPRQIADIAYQNKATIYDLLFKASSETMLTIAADPKHLGTRIRNDFGDPQPRRIGDAQRRLVFETGSRLHRYPLRSPYLGFGAQPSSARAKPTRKPAPATAGPKPPPTTHNGAATAPGSDKASLNGKADNKAVDGIDALLATLASRNRPAPTAP